LDEVGAIHEFAPTGMPPSAYGGPPGDFLDFFFSSLHKSELKILTSPLAKW